MTVPRRPSVPILVKICEHPHVVEGVPVPVYFQVADGSLFMRVDLPGISQETVRVWVDDQAILQLEGEDPKDDPDFDKESKRKFRGGIDLKFRDGVKYKTREMQYVVKNGVLKVKIPMENE